MIRSRSRRMASPAEVDVGGGEVAQALVSAGMVVVLDEDGHPRLQLAGQVGVFEQDAVLERPVPALDLALGLGLGMARRVARRMSLMTVSAGFLAGPGVCFIFAPGGYDEPAILRW